MASVANASPAGAPAVPTPAPSFAAQSAAPLQAPPGISTSHFAPPLFAGAPGAAAAPDGVVLLQMPPTLSAPLAPLISALPPPPPASPSAAAAAAAASALAPSAAPQLPLADIAKLFLSFGLRAFGGPVAQMALIKQKLVVEDRWITVARFNRVVAVYQALPGPEATELCCYFGLLAGGRPGAVVAGLAFLLPGFVLMTLIAWAYTTYGAASPAITGAMATVQVAVTAMVFRAVHKIGADNIREHGTLAAAAGSGGISTGLALTAALAAVEAVMSVNFFLTLLHCATLWAFFLQPPGRMALAAVWALAPVAAALAYMASTGNALTALIPLGVGAGALGKNLGTIFLVGLLGGLLTFGGAYTAIPFINFEAVVSGGWLSSQQFLDSIAFGQVIPAPLVMFTCFVGYASGGFLGAVLMTLGMFLPAFSFTLIGHEYFERLVEAKGAVAHLLDGVSAAVAGLIAVTAVQLLKAAVVKPIDAVTFGASLAILYLSTHRYTAPMLVFAAVLVGFVLVSPAAGR